MVCVCKQMSSCWCKTKLPLNSDYQSTSMTDTKFNCFYLHVQKFLKIWSVSICKQLDVIVDKSHGRVVWRHYHLTTKEAKLSWLQANYIITAFWILYVRYGNRQWHVQLGASCKPGNRAGSVAGTNFVVCSYGKFQPGRPGQIKETKPKWHHISLHPSRLHSFVESCNLSNKTNSSTIKVEMHTRQKCHFGLPCCESEANLSKKVPSR